MKQLITHLLAITLLFGAYSCNENTSDKEHGIYVKNVVSSLCGKNLESSGSDNQEYIKYSALDNKTLKIEQKLFVNCCSEDFKVKINVEGSNLTINITNDDPEQCNCICPLVLSYEIVNLQESNTYKLIFSRNEYEYAVCELLFTNSVNGEVLE